MIHDDRRELANKLEDILGVIVHVSPPNPPRPPVAFLNEADVFITPDETYGTVKASFELTIVATVSDIQDKQISELDLYLDKLINSDVYQWITSTSGYMPLTAADGQPLLAVQVNLTLNLRKGEKQ